MLPKCSNKCHKINSQLEIYISYYTFITDISICEHAVSDRKPQYRNAKLCGDLESVSPSENLTFQLYNVS